MNKATTVRLPDNLKAKVKEKASKDGMTINAIIQACWQVDINRKFTKELTELIENYANSLLEESKTGKEAFLKLDDLREKAHEYHLGIAVCKLHQTISELLQEKINDRLL